MLFQENFRDMAQLNAFQSVFLYNYVMNITTTNDNDNDNENFI